MKDRKRKNRDWKNDCRIMRKYGGSIRKEIERTLIKVAVNTIKHEKLKVITDTPRLPVGAYKDISKKVTWIT